jgi:hypothetical protein
MVARKADMAGKLGFDLEAAEGTVRE